VIRFTPEMARQCGSPGSSFPDWVVCDTISNGSRRPLLRPGPRGGTVVRFTKTFARASTTGATSRRRITVRVLGEMTPQGCFALRILASAKTCAELWSPPGFFNRPYPK
jgi:hypothetical protein